MQILREDIDPSSLDPKKLTNDCKFVRRFNGDIDLVRGNMVKIFDHYWDRGIKIVKIWHAGGTRNPKLLLPEY